MRSDGRLRILLAAPETTGGIGRHVRALSDVLLQRGHAVTVCAPEPTLERLDPAATGADTVPLPLGHSAALRYLRRLAALAREHDVTHAHGVRVGAQLALARATPFVVTWHNAPLGTPTRRMSHRLLEQLCARRAAFVVGASDDLVARAAAAGAAQSRFLAVVAPEHPARVAARTPSLRQPPTVLTVARLHPQKRVDLLVEVAAGWPAGPDRPRFLVAGDGPSLEALQNQAVASRAPVTFLGASNDVASLLAEADVVVLPSDWEARPFVAQEALRAGVPLVATDVGGVRALVGGAAVLVPPASAAALADGVRRVLTDGALRAELQRAGPVRAAEWPTVDDMVDGLLAIYLSVSREAEPRTT